MCAHGIKWDYTNKDLLRDYEIPGVVAFNRFFKDSDCILTDSRGIFNTLKEQPEEGNKYVVLHMAKSLEFNQTGFIEDLPKEELCKMV